MESRSCFDFAFINRAPKDVTLQLRLTAVDKIGMPSLNISHEKSVLEKGKGLNWNQILFSNELKAKPTLFHNGALKIKCELTIYPSESEKINQTNSFEIPNLTDDLKSILMNPATSDFNIICEKKTFPCHKTILASRSDVFKAMFANKRSKEYEKNEVEIIDFKSHTIRDFLQFLYTDDIETKYNDVALLLIADKYNVPRLKKKCESALENHIDIDNAIELLMMASLVDAPGVYFKNVLRAPFSFQSLRAAFLYLLFGFEFLVPIFCTKIACVKR